MSENLDKKTNIKKILIIVSIIIVIAIITIICIYYYINTVLPANKLAHFNELFDNKDYVGVINQESDLVSIKKYLDNESKYAEVEEKVMLSKVFNCYNNKKYIEALEIINGLESKKTDILQIENDCKYIIAKEKIQLNKFEDALELLDDVKDKDDLDELKDSAHFGLAKQYADNNDYTNVLNELELINNKSIEGYIDIKNKANYEIGKQLFNKKDFDKAIERFDLCIEYEDSNSYKLKCSMGKAESLIKESKYDDAKVIYDSLPDEIEYNGVISANRKKQLVFYKNNLNAIGEWKSTKEYIESKNIYKRNGSWDNWYINEPSGSTKLTVDLVFNNDGTMSLKANASFYAFSNFSSLQSLCNAKMTYKSTEVKSITSMPNTIKLDDYTTLTRSGSTYTLKYSKRDDYSISFYNMYNSTITFGNKIK